MTIAWDELLTLLRDSIASVRDPGAAAALAARLASPADGEALCAVIDRERVAPLVHRALAGLTVPDATRDALRQVYRATAMRNLVLLHELRGLLDRLAAAGVEAIVLKGAALAEPIYGSLALRPMSDLDILIHGRDLPRARAVVEGLGFQPLRLETHPGVLAEHENEQVFSRPGHVRVDLDVHWSLLDSPFYQRELGMQWFWDTAREQTLGGHAMRTLGTEALLLHLCSHLMLHHQGDGLLWWNDIAEVLRVERDTIDWSELFECSTRFHLLMPMREVLSRLAAEWHAPIPSAALQRYAQAQPSREEAMLFPALTGDASPGRRFWVDLRSMGGWREGLHYARTNLLPSPTYMRERYGIRHPFLVALYYPYRWFRGVGDLMRRR